MLQDTEIDMDCVKRTPKVDKPILEVDKCNDIKQKASEN